MELENEFYDQNTDTVKVHSAAECVLMSSCFKKSSLQIGDSE